ncbi:MAG: adenosylcobinamide-phosphate synthase CbiB [Actinobacteria bacterium]|nr:adenosylcobinamide-phosphate synthase CbiB [Actinomycetota bacterium]
MSLLPAAAGLLADRVLGEPPAALHPVRGFGAVMRGVERRAWRDSRSRGVVHASGGVLLGAAAGFGVASTAGATWLSVGARALWTAASEVATALAAHDLDAAREALPSLVGRDPTDLDEKEMARAVIESVAENTVDAIVAPVLWAAVAGAPGALGYRAVNTLDAMVGHHSPRYENFGWASARLDDLAGWVPARVTAGLVAAVRPRGAGRVWVAVRRDAPAHPSPNAGVAEAAFAAALGLRLGGTNVYGERVEVRPPLGDGPPPEPADIGRAIRLSSDVAWALAAGLVLASSRRARGRGRR